MSEFSVESPPATADATATEATAAEATAALTAAVAAGNPQAIERFYRQFFPLLFGEARRATRGDEAFCLDVVQEAVLKIIGTIRAVEHEWQLIAWLKLVVRTSAYDLIRSESRRRRREAQAHADIAHTYCNDAGAKEQLEWLKQAIGSMDPQISRMIDLRFQRRWTLTRIGAALGLSTATVDGRLRRALHHLRTLAREKFDE